MTPKEINLSHLNISMNRSGNQKISDFRNFPRPYTALGYYLEGSMSFYEGERCESVSENELIFVPQGSTYYSTYPNDSRHIAIYLSMAHFSTSVRGRGNTESRGSSETT